MRVKLKKNSTFFFFWGGGRAGWGRDGLKVYRPDQQRSDQPMI